MVIKKSSSVRVQFGPATSLFQFQHIFLLVKSDDPAGAPKKYWCDRTRILSDCWLGLAIISTYPSKIICWGLKIAYEGLRMHCKLTRPLLYLYSGRSLSTWASMNEPVSRTSATWKFGKDWCHSDSAGPQTLQSCWYDLHSYYCIKGSFPRFLCCWLLRAGWDMCINIVWCFHYISDNLE